MSHLASSHTARQSNREPEQSRARLIRPEQGTLQCNATSYSPSTLAYKTSLPYFGVKLTIGHLGVTVGHHRV